MLVNSLKLFRFSQILMYKEESLTSFLYLTECISDILRLSGESYVHLPLELCVQLIINLNLITMLVNSLKLFRFSQILMYKEESLTSFLYLTECISDILRLSGESYTFTNSHIY
jgi:uncharacterized membrane protein